MEEQQIPTVTYYAGELICDRYEVVCPLGMGGMGTVYKVLDRALDNEVVALKMLHPHMAVIQRHFHRFRNEVVIARRLTHPNIVRIFDFGAAGRGYYYITMEFIDGCSLDRLLHGSREQRPNFAETLNILLQICDGLQYAHRMGVVHRDLKPDNVILYDGHNLKIADFGLARCIDMEKSLTPSGEAVGTPYYMAPEQLRGQKADGRADIYSLGIMAFEMVVGRRPFFHDSYMTLAAMHLQQQIPRFAGKGEELYWFQEFVLRCTAKNKEERFSTCQQVADVLTAHCEEHGISAIRPKPAVLGLYNEPASLSSGGPWRSLFLLPFLLGLVALSVGFGFVWGPALQGFFKEKTASSSTAIANSVHQGTQQAGSLSLEDQKRLFSRIASGDAEVVEMMLRAGVSPNVQDQVGNSALHQAVLNKQLKVMQVLGARGVDVNIRDAQDRTALHLAAQIGRRELIEELLAMKAELDARDKLGNTALHYAILERDAKSARLLLERGASAGLINNQGRTARELAESNKLVEVFVRTAVTGDLESQSNEASAPLGLRDTRLMAQGKLRFESTRHPRRGLIVSKIIAEVRNAGDVTAEEVDVQFHFAQGSPVRLVGPNRLGRYSSAEFVYLVKLEETILPQFVESGQLVLLCKNCLSKR